jgi:hypothetical protein
VNGGVPEGFVVPAPNKIPNLTYNKVGSVVIKKRQNLELYTFSSHSSSCHVYNIVLFNRVNGLKHHRKMGL